MTDAPNKKSWLLHEQGGLSQLEIFEALQQSF